MYRVLCMIYRDKINIEIKCENILEDHQVCYKHTYLGKELHYLHH